jgi:hypothetical protein
MNWGNNTRCLQPPTQGHIENARVGVFRDWDPFDETTNVQSANGPLCPVCPPSWSGGDDTIAVNLGGGIGDSIVPQNLTLSESEDKEL